MLYQKPLTGDRVWSAQIVDMSSFPLHRHHEAELAYCLEGQTDITVNGRVITLRSGQLLYVAPFTPHEYRSESGAKVAVAEFGHALLKEDFLPFTKFPELYRLYDSPCEVTEKMTRLCAHLTGEAPTARLDVISAIYALAAAVLRDTGSSDDYTGDRSFERIEPALTLIYMKYTEDIKIEDACRATNLSPGNFCTIFKKATGMSFHKYLNSYRIRNCCYLLKGTDMTTEEIFSLSGFCDLKTFYRVFKSETGTSPSKFRGN